MGTAFRVIGKDIEWSDVEMSLSNEQSGEIRHNHSKIKAPEKMTF